MGDCVCVCVCMKCYQVLTASCFCCIFLIHHDSGSAPLSLPPPSPPLIPNTKAGAGILTKTSVSTLSSDRTLWSHYVLPTTALSTCFCVCVCVHIHSHLLSHAGGLPNKLSPSPPLDSSSSWLYWTNKPEFVKLKPNCRTENQTLILTTVHCNKGRFGQHQLWITKSAYLFISFNWNNGVLLLSKVMCLPF